MIDLRSIARALGGEVSGQQVLAPGPGHTPRDRSLAVSLSHTAPDGFVAFSHAGDDWRECRDYVRERLGLPEWRPGDGPAVKIAAMSRKEDHGAEPRDSTDDEKVRAAAARTLFEQAQPIDGVPEVAGYLAARGGLDVGACKGELRYSPAMVWENERRGCLLAAYRNLDTGEITGVARILVDEPERWPQTQRKMLGVVRRAAVKLVPVTDTLAVAEGCETAIAANMMGYGPAWALGSAGAVKKLPVLPGIERLVLLEENNAASRDAIECCGRRWVRAGRKVTRVRPDRGHDDLNDELISKRNI